MTIQQLLDLTILKNASDLHLAVGFPPLMRIDGELSPVPGEDIIAEEQMNIYLDPLLTDIQRELFTKDWELDFSFEYHGKGRFRVNLYKQKGTIAASLRLIPLNIKTLSELSLPKIFSRVAELKQGFVLVTGPTGHGKSTTIASLINIINQSRNSHIISIEDPIEYVYPPGKSLVSQREILSDTRNWGNALRSVLREDPDVVLIGEMRDLETISSAITIAETGHLVFGTLHTNSAAQAVDRVIDVFPESQQPQIRLQFAATFEAVISQRLVPTLEPGRIPAVEILFATPAARNMIRESKTFLLDNLIETSAELGMISLESSLAALVKSGKISSEAAINYSIRPDLLVRLLK